MKPAYHCALPEDDLCRSRHAVLSTQPWNQEQFESADWFVPTTFELKYGTWLRQLFITKVLLKTANSRHLSYDTLIVSSFLLLDIVSCCSSTSVCSRPTKDDVYFDRSPQSPGYKRHVALNGVLFAPFAIVYTRSTYKLCKKTSSITARDGLVFAGQRYVTFYYFQS